MTNHLVRILLVQALRTYVDVEDRPHGWLGALVDAKIGAALALMHLDGGGSRGCRRYVPIVIRDAANREPVVP
jgi:hypothetical protein